MAEVVITKIRDAFKLFEDSLNAAVLTLDQQDRIVVERITTLENYKPRSARGGFGLMFNGSNFSKDPRIGGTSLIMKDDLFIGVVSAITHIDQMNEPIEKQPMLPAEYTELAVNTMSGIEIWNKRPETERKIYPVRSELIDEENGKWKYLTTFCVPRDFIESSLA